MSGEQGMLMFPFGHGFFVLLTPGPLGHDQSQGGHWVKSSSTCYPNKQDIPSSCPAQAPSPRVIAEAGGGGGQGELSSEFVYLSPILYLLLAPLLCLA